MKKVLIFIKHEFLKMLPPTIFFFVVFHLIAFLRALMVEQYGINISSYVAATIGALIVGKAILLADALPFVNLFHNKAGIYSVIWKTCLYASIAFLFQFIEELIPFISKYGANLAAIDNLIEETQWPSFLATHILVTLFIALYNVATVAVNAIGSKTFIQMFFNVKNGCSTKEN